VAETASHTRSRTGFSAAEHLDRLRLIRSQNVGPMTFAALIEQYGTAAQALDALPDLALAGGARTKLHICNVAQAEHELRAAQRLGAKPVFLGEPDFPPRLAAIAGAPALIYALGDDRLSRADTVAIVGARNGSAAGRKFAFQLAQELGARGWIIVSGLARGIDAAAHEGALASGTIAVLAGGIDMVYPPENQMLHHNIARSGLLIAESPPGFQPRGKDFPRRNRIVSGLALGVVIVEATRASGSMITAHHASDQGREVMAVPGHPLDPRAEGPNRLIRDGAVLITCAGDIIEALANAQAPRGEAYAAGPDAADARGPGFQERDEPAFMLDERARAMVLELLGPVPVLIDDIVHLTGLGARAVSIALIELELAGRLVREGHNRVALAGFG
jgi:DNA processing protein